MENNIELSPPDLEQPADLTPTPEPSKPVTSADDLWDRMEDEGIQEDVAEAISSGGDELTESKSSVPKNVSTVTSSLSPVRELSQRVEHLNNARAEFQQACSQIEGMYQRNEINQDQYNQAVANARLLDVQIREEQLGVQAHHDNLQRHYAGMLSNLEKEFPAEWNRKTAPVTQNRIYNVAEKLGLPKDIVTEAAEVPGVLAFLTRVTNMHTELQGYKQRERKNKSGTPMANKVANLTAARDKQQEMQNNLVGYTNKKGQAAQLDQIAALLHKNGIR
jgi:hypothetical protein